MEKVRLGDISILINGDRGKNYPSQSDIMDDGEIPFVNAGHLNGRDITFDKMNYISQDKYEKLSSGKFQKGDILYCLRGSLGKKAFVRENVRGAIASSLVIIRPDLEKVMGDYLMFALNSPRIQEQLVKANNGSSQPNLSAASVKKYEVELPELVRQKEIVENLVRVRDIIDYRKRELQLLDDLIKARFVEMFGRPTDRVSKYPKEKISKLIKDNKANVKAGPFGSSLKKEFYVEKGYKIYGQEQVIKDDPFYGNYYIDEERFNSLKSCEVHAGDILISLVGTCGKTMIMPSVFEPGIINPRLLKVSFDSSVILPIYFKFFFSCDDLQESLNAISGHSTMNVVNAGMLKEIELIIPPIFIQEEFSAFVEQVNKSKVAVQKALDEAQLLFDSLMQEYFG